MKSKQMERLKSISNFGVLGVINFLELKQKFLLLKLNQKIRDCSLLSIREEEFNLLQLNFFRIDLSNLNEIVGGQRPDNRVTLLLKDSQNTATLVELTGPTTQAYASVLARIIQPSGNIQKLSSDLLGALTGTSTLPKKTRKTLLRLATHGEQNAALQTVLANGTNPALHGLSLEQNEPILVIDRPKTSFEDDNSRASKSGQPYLDRFLADS